MERINLAEGASVRRRIALLGVTCVALGLCAGLRLLQLEGWSVATIVCLALGTAVAALSVHPR